jgi:predicted transcriptional regulator
MKLRDYLDARGESENAFAKRSGIPQRTINRIANGGECLAGTAIEVIRASMQEPAPGGGIVDLDSLAGD